MIIDIRKRLKKIRKNGSFSTEEFEKKVNQVMSYIQSESNLHRSLNPDHALGFEAKVINDC